MQTLILYIALALIAGAMVPTQAALNNKMAGFVGSPYAASLISFIVGTAALMLVVLATGNTPTTLAGARNAPAIAWFGGLLGAFFVAATVILIPRLGVAAGISLIIAGQMAASLVIDHFGLLGTEVRPASLIRFIGVLLITAGVVIVRKY